LLLCYIDESGTPDIPGNTSHYILAGLSIPVSKWKNAENEIQKIKAKYRIADKEIHTAWIMRKYLEQSRISNFEKLPEEKRIYEVEKIRKAEILKLQKIGGSTYKQARKNYKETSDYIHLTYDERKLLISDLAQMIASWDYARLFAECIDKVSYDPSRHTGTIAEQALEQVTTRFEYCLLNLSNSTGAFQYGLLIHDNNETVSKKHTALMKEFHRTGTLWKKIPHIIETPLFVNSNLTNMVQLADLCAYSLRRYLENKEDGLFDMIFQRADRKNGKAVGIRHFPGSGCSCKICKSHK
jgi:hypothetical protein